MTAITAPEIDLRRQEELVEQIRNLITHYISGKDTGKALLADDPQIGTLVNIFSRLMEINIQKLNKALDKNFMAFLDILGINLTPPRPARVALCFSLAKGTKQHVFVEKGTRVATEKSPDKKPVVFETDSDITVILPQLVKAVSLVPANDRFADHSAAFFGEGPERLEILFKGNQLTPHRLFIGDSQSFAFKETKNLRLRIELEPVKQRQILKQVLPEFFKTTLGKSIPDWDMLGGKRETGTEQIIQWYRFDKESGNPVSLEIDIKDNEYDPEVVNLQQPGCIPFINLNGIAEKELTGYEAANESERSWSGHWIFAELQASARDHTFPKIRSITSRIELTAAGEKILPEPRLPDHAFFDQFEIDLTRDFYPFGKRPAFNATFYLASAEAFQHENALVTLNVALSDGMAKPDTKAVTLVWEYYNGKQWAKLGQSNQDGPVAEKSSFTDHTCAFTFKNQDAASTVQFSCPAVKPIKLFGIETCWIRVRLIGGNYGGEAGYAEITTYSLNQSFFDQLPELIAKEGSADVFDGLKGTAYAAPEIISADVSAISRKTGLSETLLQAITNLATQSIDSQTVAEYVDATFTPPSLKSLTIHYETVSFNPPQSILTNNDFFFSEYKAGKSFIPFTPIQDQNPALYLAFDQSVAELPVTLFFPLLSEGLISPLQDGETTPPVLSWEYWSGRTWSPLMVIDNTKELTRREMVQLLPPKNLGARVCFGEYRYWIRAVLTKGAFPLIIKSASIYSNAVWSYNRITVSESVLGSGTGGPNQVISTPHYPVLAGQKLRIRETSLTDDEVRIIKTEEGDDAIDEITDATGNVTGYWVRWHQVPHFHASAPGNRHYVINHHQGTISFGDGTNGLIPTAGKNNIKFEHYQYGGGERGNAAARTVTKLLSSIPYLDKVTNPLAAEGGVNVEGADQVKTRGSRTLRTRNRCITYQDYEWIVLEATPKAAKAKCLSVTNPIKQFKPGWVTVIVVPDSQQNKPLPTEELLDEIRSYLYQRSAVNLVDRAQPTINLIPPNYLRVDITIETIVTSINEVKQVEARVADRLKEFLHPITGGPRGTGWEFGRDVYIAEIYEAVEKIAGVNVVETVSLSAPIQIFRLRLAGSFFSTFSLPAQSRVYCDYEKIIFSLAETIPAKVGTATVKLVGFMEGDQVEIFNLLKDQNGVPVKSGERVQLSVTAVLINHNTALKTGILQCAPVTSEYDFPAGSIVETFLKAPEYRIRSYLVNPIVAGDQLNEVTIALPNPGYDVMIRHRDWPSNKVTGGIARLESDYDQIYLPEDYLVYAGTIDVITKLTPSAESEATPPDQGDTTKEEWFRFILNKRSGEVHDLVHETANCNLEKMKPENKVLFRSLDEIQNALEAGKIDFCAYCFGGGFSKR